MEGSLFDQIVFWHWLILALALGVLEMFAPGVLFLWLGIAAAITGLALLAIPSMSWEAQFLVFAGLSFAAVVAGRMWLRRRPIATDHPKLNRRGEQYVGRRFTLDEPIVNGVGKLRVDDTTWKITGDDLPAGSRVTVTGVDGTVLVVSGEPAGT
ncbi:MAG: NfeD family protein [Hyphomicrobiales bacterium]|nr:NfeD family protein [Hyphomicrobiales bacterium]MCP5371870.1 NfeD family protein [Hyphomicrobiales bacterium]